MTNDMPPKHNDIRDVIVPAEGKRFRIQRSLLPLGVIAIYSMIIPIVIADISLFLYQNLYFTAMGIPKIKKNQYVRFERWDLSKLTLFQKINCVYCEYANGVLAYAKAVGNQTEIYSCAIKHHHALKGHEHEKDFYPKEKFD